MTLVPVTTPTDRMELPWPRTLQSNKTMRRIFDTITRECSIVSLKTLTIVIVVCKRTRVSAIPLPAWDCVYHMVLDLDWAESPRIVYVLDCLNWTLCLKPGILPHFISTSATHRK